MVVVEHFADGHEEVAGPFVAANPEGGSRPVLTYWKDGLFITRYADTGMSFHWYDASDVLYETPDCTGSKYLETHPPVPYGHVFVIWGWGDTVGSGAHLWGETARAVQLMSMGPWNLAGPSPLCRALTPRSALVYEVVTGPSVPYWNHRWAGEYGSSLTVEVR